MAIFVNSSTTKESIKKNVRLNRITKLLRSSTFDKNAVNTNVNLTSNELTNYYKKINRKLNNNLCVDLTNPRNRKNSKLDVSTIRDKRDYDKFLDHIVENDDDNLLDEMNSQNRSQIIEEDNLDSERKSLKISGKNILNNLNVKQKKEKHETKNNNNKGIDYTFKAKSIEKNIIKYPVEHSNDFLVKEENRPYSAPLTIVQEGIRDNMRGKKFFMNYLYNILDKDLKVKDTFNVKHWEKEILGRKEKYIKVKELPEIIEPLFVFNDKKLNLKKYLYMYHKDKIFKDQDFSILTHNLKFLPNNVLQLMPVRLRNFGRYAAGKEINLGTLGNKAISGILGNMLQVKKLI